MIKVVKLKPVITFALVVLCGIVACLGTYKIAKVNSQTKLNYTIVLDAGHGGIDGGCVGSTTGISEAEINLSVTKKLESLLTGFGFRVVLTRTNSNGLYSITSTNKKQDDLQKRKQIIVNANPNLLVSIHMNSYVNSSEHGAQTFYQTGSENSKHLATTIQAELVKNLTDARANCNQSDLYILKCVSAPSVVVEGGFLSNPTDESLLVTSEYQQQMAYSIFCGILKYFEIVSTI